MKKIILSIFYFIGTLLISCFGDGSHKQKNIKQKINVDTINTRRADNINNYDNELESNDEIIEDKQFSKWKDEYHYFFQYIDHKGISSDLKAKINLIKSDSCVFESWFEDPNDEQYNKNGYLKLLGHIYVSDDKNLKIIFLENTVLNGESPELDPVFTLINKKNEFYIESFLTSPPHNGIIEMPIQKIK
ncbi:Uncharacterised protein [Chryseobacterium nakagawai]|uniref:hypothetical protein n=1 Tax=Chryseobacterium nakagawai TaxID=1241982 RepID=UPI000F4D8AD7|nr:hypothetical protein [Chryseobacterium nakagawai]VEH21150.1 Uncharacterised protein [Chryseobacterium nakagawai]